MKLALRLATFWLATTAAAFAQDAQPDITVKLTPAEVAEIARLVDLAAPSTFVSRPPSAYWDLQITISRALEADPAALRAVNAAAKERGQ